MVIGNHNLEAVLHDTFVSGHGCRLVRLSLRGQGVQPVGQRKGPARWVGLFQLALQPFRLQGKGRSQGESGAFIIPSCSPCWLEPSGFAEFTND